MTDLFKFVKNEMFSPGDNFELLRKLKEEANSLTRKVSELTQQLETLNASNKLLTEEVKSLGDQNERYLKTNEVLTQKVEDLTRQLTNSNQDLTPNLSTEKKMEKVMSIDRDLHFIDGGLDNLEFIEPERDNNNNNSHFDHINPSRHQLQHQHQSVYSQEVLSLEDTI